MAVVPFMKYTQEPNSWVLISIGEPGEDKPKVPESCLDVLRVELADVDRGIEGYIKFSQAHAKKILDFYHKYKHTVKTFIIHCTAGISRSAGVAAALHRIHYNEDDQTYWTKYLPNMLVYRTIIRVHCGATDNEIV